ncbi:translation initiation factor IF-2-like isoform X1 [Canis lupus familiaris]|uniref:translation initiation factor IF-2-like isoform X1 n=1 Tax=Canis lupus familiaris TaxID=9615 RepID=UPI0018F4FD1C|nr:translation initiation factor IF-2-like isoform X1 [Canis lupus familiaris]
MARPSRAPRGVPAARGCRGAGAGLRAGPSAGSSSQRGVPGRAAPGLGALGLRRGAECPAHRRLRSRPGARGRARCALLPDGAGAPAAGLCLPPTRPAVEVARGGGARKRGAAPGPPPPPPTARPLGPAHLCRWEPRCRRGGSPATSGRGGLESSPGWPPLRADGDTEAGGQGLSRETQRFRTSPASAEGWDPQGQWRNAGHLQKTLQLFSLQLLSLVLKCPGFSSALRESVNIKEGIRGVTGNSFISLDADAPHADAKMPTISCLLFVELPLIVEAAF